MRDWLGLLGGLIVWAMHFFFLYAFGEFVGTGGAARSMVVAVTIACLIGCGLVARLLPRDSSGDDYGQWRLRTARTLALLSGIAILWQGLPALFVP